MFGERLSDPVERLGYLPMARPEEAHIAPGARSDALLERIQCLPKLGLGFTALVGKFS